MHCPYCQDTDIVRHGKSPEGKQRYRCRQCREGQGRTFLLDYSYSGQSPTVKEQIVETAMNASGIRDTARVLKTSPTTMISELKKKEFALQTVNYALLSVLNSEQVEVGILKAEELDQRRVVHSMSCFLSKAHMSIVYFQWVAKPLWPASITWTSLSFQDGTDA